jgi:hypothetical protein
MTAAPPVAKAAPRVHAALQHRRRRTARDVPRHLPGPRTAAFALRAHPNAPCKTGSLWETLRALERPGRARTVATSSGSSPLPPDASAT